MWFKNKNLYTENPSKFSQVLEKWDDFNWVLNTVRRNGTDLRHASERLRANKQIVIEAVSEDVHALKHASKELKKDREILEIAFTSNGYSIKYVPYDVQINNIDLVKIAVVEAPDALQYVHPDLQNSREIVIAAITHDGTAIRHASDNLRADRDIVILAVSQSGKSLQYVPWLNDDREIVKIAVKQNGLALQFASEDLQKDREIVKIAVSENGRALSCVPPELQGDLEIVKLAIMKDESAFEFIPNELKTPEFISKLFPRNTKPTHYTPNISIHGKVPKLKELISQLQEIKQQPITDKQKYHNTVNKIKHQIKQLSGHNIETLEQLYEILKDKQYKFRTKTLDWDGSQTFTRNPEKVFAIYWDRNLYRELGQDPILAKLLMHKPRNTHFNDFNAPVGWALVYQKDKDTWIINQVQSDLFADFQNIKRKLETKAITLDHLFDQLRANDRSGYIELLEQPEFEILLSEILRNPGLILDLPIFDPEYVTEDLRTKDEVIDALIRQQSFFSRRNVGDFTDLQEHKINYQEAQYIEEKLGWLIKDWYNLVFHHVWQEARKAGVTNLYWNTSKTVEQSLSEGARNVYYESVPRNLGFKKKEVNFRDKPEEMWYRESRSTSWFKRAAKMSVQEALSIFGLDSMPDPKTLKHKYNELIFKHHPDMGGTHEMAASVTNAYATLKNLETSYQDIKQTREDIPWETDPRATYRGFGKNRMDINYCKKEIYEYSIKNGPVSEYTLWAFDGSFFRGVMTVKTNPASFGFAGKVMEEWDRWYPIVAVFVEPRYSKKFRLIRLHGKDVSDQSIILEGDPNDQKFLNELREFVRA